jgi:hypothetical protein
VLPPEHAVTSAAADTDAAIRKMTFIRFPTTVRK